MSARDRRELKKARRASRASAVPPGGPVRDPAPGKQLPVCYEVADLENVPPSDESRSRGVTSVACWVCGDPACPVLPGQDPGPGWNRDLLTTAMPAGRVHLLVLHGGAEPPPRWDGPFSYETCADPGCPDFGLRPVFLEVRAERLAARCQELAGAAGPGEFLPSHSHVHPLTREVALTSSWPCPQCVALGRTRPMRYGDGVPDEGGVTLTPIPGDVLPDFAAAFLLSRRQAPPRPRPAS
ncbi:MAG TPA: hypothetical protein VMK13_12575 [Streptosporangiaceae bacterium]|nr:hypothetical protein [Streptosporangiaceae bacterium]